VSVCFVMVMRLTYNMGWRDWFVDRYLASRLLARVLNETVFADL